MYVEESSQMSPALDKKRGVGHYESNSLILFSETTTATKPEPKHRLDVNVKPHPEEIHKGKGIERAPPSDIFRGVVAIVFERGGPHPRGIVPSNVLPQKRIIMSRFSLQLGW